MSSRRNGRSRPRHATGSQTAAAPGTTNDQENDVHTAPDPGFDPSALDDYWGLRGGYLRAEAKADEAKRCVLDEQAKIAEKLQGHHQEAEQVRQRAEQLQMLIADAQSAYDAAGRRAAGHEADAAAARRLADTHEQTVEVLRAKHGITHHPKDVVPPEMQQTGAYPLPSPNGTQVDPRRDALVASRGTTEEDTQGFPAPRQAGQT